MYYIHEFVYNYVHISLLFNSCKKKYLKMGIMIIGQKRSIYEQSRHIECVKRIKVDSTDVSSIETGIFTLDNKTNKQF